VSPRPIEELKAEEARLRAVLASGAEAELRAIPGVVHVSVGLKQINDTATDEHCIRVYVKKKKSPSEVPPNERIPKRIQGIATDVNEVQVADLAVDKAKYRPLTGGCEISNNVVVDADDNVDVGTLGCFATDQTDLKTVLLTSFHVIGNTAGTPVFQPLAADMDQIGTVKRGQPTGNIDAAIADIDPAFATTVDAINGLFLNGSNHVAGVDDPVSGMHVFKVGRTTGLTAGKVVDADAPVGFDLGPPTGWVDFEHFMIIQCVKTSKCCCCSCELIDKSRKFVDRGDSGAAVLSDKRIAVGLVVGMVASAAYACRMTLVESLLNIRINKTIVVADNLVETPASAGGPHIVAGGSATSEPVFARTEAIGAAPSAEDETLWSTMQRRLEESPFGREIAVQARAHLPEGIDLVNHQRAVMVAWQRVQGPSFLAQWMNGIRNPDQPVPREINGVDQSTALLKMAAVLKQHGSDALRQSIDAYGLDLMAVLDRSTTVYELLENLDKPVAV
jgi:hypothetical protein